MFHHNQRPEQPWGEVEFANENHNLARVERSRMLSLAFSAEFRKKLRACGFRMIKLVTTLRNFNGNLAVLKSEKFL